MVRVSTLADSCSSKAATDPSSTGMHLRKAITRILVDFLHRHTRCLIGCNLRVGAGSKSLLTISSLLFLVAIPAMAQAGATISDRRYWPSEARSGGYVLGGANSVTNSALGWDSTMAHVQPAEKPKAFLRHYRRGSAAR